MTVRVLWGLCLGLGAMLTGVGIELHASGSGPLVSYSVVVAGILFLPLASAVIERVMPATATPPE